MCLGVPGRVLAIDDEGGLPMAQVDFGGIRRDVCLVYLPETQVGSYVIVHVGFAITEVNEAEAQRTLEVLRTMDGDALAAELGEPAPGSGVATTPSPGLP
jgi:hydrogenase expression/formation protein HypC